jgi:hypothetical protein
VAAGLAVLFSAQHLRPRPRFVREAPSRVLHQRCYAWNIAGSYDGYQGVVATVGVALRQRRHLVWLATLAAAVIGLACSSSPPAPPAPPRLVLNIPFQFQGLAAGTQSSVSLRTIDPETLADLDGASPLEAGVGACGVGPVVRGSGNWGVVVENSTTFPGAACPSNSQLKLRLIDFAAWRWGREVVLDAPPDRTLELAWAPAPPLIWSADGLRLFVFTANRSSDLETSVQSGDERRQLWIVDTQGTRPPTAVPLEAAPWRVNLAPSGVALYVLGYQTRGPSRLGYLDPGSTVLLIIDPATGATRSRVPLPRVKLAALPVRGETWYDPGVALAPNGRYYYVAHPDEPIVDVVDVFAPGLERLERSITIESVSSTDSVSTAAWLGISPDGGRLYSRRANLPAFAGSWPMQVVDTHTWTVATFDPQAAYLQFSPNGQWLYASDQPAAPGTGGLLFFGVGGPLFVQSMPANIGLRVFDAPSGRQLSSIMNGQVVLQVSPSQSNRLYAVFLPAADAGALQAPQVARTGFDAVDLVVYETGTWRELARRSWQSPISLVETS